MKIALGADHAGYALKELIKNMLSPQYSVVDIGTYSSESVDYPDFAFKLAQAIREKSCDRGIMLCGSGVGACIAANKIKGARAAICHDTYSAHQGVEHDDMNILVLGARIIGESLAFELVNTFLNARFSSEERHVRRLKKIIASEQCCD